MAGYSCDRDGIVRMTDESGKVLFDRKESIAVTGWSNHPQIASKFKNVVESTGSGKEKS